MSSDLLEDLRKTTRKALTAGGGDVVDQLDLSGLLLDGDAGGLGMGEREMVLVGEEIGRHAAPSAFLQSAVLAATLLAGTSDGIELAKALAHCRYAVALAGLDTAAAGLPRIVATAGADGGWLLDGTCWGLTPSGAAGDVLAVATTDAGAALFVVNGAAVTRSAADEFDPGRGLIEMTFDQAPARSLAQAAEAAGAIRVAYRRALLAVAAEQLGVARACLEMTVEYAKTRTQFGAAIGSFQAIKHRCAEVLLDTEFADAAIQQAIETGGSDDLALAFLVATRAAVSAAESCIHVHGGIGFTWEHRAHWYLRRARVNATLLGPPDLHRNVIAESVGLAEAGRK
ncbi:acyl-CoA dehydrogenase family protein [Mycolicibacterium sp. XJ662]